MTVQYFDEDIKCLWYGTPRYFRKYHGISSKTLYYYSNITKYGNILIYIYIILLGDYDILSTW